MPSAKILEKKKVECAELTEKIQNAVASAVEAMTGFVVKAVNVHVGGISFQ